MFVAAHFIRIRFIFMASVKMGHATHFRQVVCVCALLENS